MTPSTKAAITAAIRAALLLTEGHSRKVAKDCLRDAWNFLEDEDARAVTVSGGLGRVAIASNGVVLFESPPADHTLVVPALES